MSNDQQRHLAKIGGRLCNLIEDLAGVEDITLAGAEMIIRQWAAGAAPSLDPIIALRESVKRAGSQKAWAARASVSPAYVTDALKGRRDLGEALLKALSLEKVVTYRRKA